MPSQFIRKYDLLIDSGNGLAVSVTELKIVFEITKTMLGFPNLAKIDIYNASPETLAGMKNKFAKITLNAGYKGNVRLLFKGNVRNAFQTRQGVDLVTTIYAGDGERDWQNGTFNKTLSENVTIKSVVEEISAGFVEVIKGELLGLDAPADKLRGQTLSGSSKDVLDQLAEDYGFQWSVQNGELITLPDQEALKPNEAILIRADTGMLGSPTVTEIGADVKTLLNPDLVPGRLFKIESVGSEISLGNLFFRNVKRTNAEGVYKVQEVLYKGDTHADEWSSSVKGMVFRG